MGLSHVIPAGVVFIPIFFIVTTIPGITNTILQINESAIEVSSVEESILNTHFNISNVSAVENDNLIFFDVTNTGNTKLWDYDNFDLLLTYDGVVGTTTTNVTEKLSYTETEPTGDPIEFDAATGRNLGCLILLNPCEFDHTVTTSGSNRILIVGLNTAGVDAIDEVRYDNVLMTNIAKRNNGVSASVSLWYLVNPSTGTNKVSITLAAVTNVAAGAVSFTGVNQTDPINTFNSASGNSLTPLVTLTTTADEAWIVDVVGTNGGTVSTGPDQVERWNVAQGVTRGAGSTEFTSSAGTFSISWTKDPDPSNWAIIAAALKPNGVPCCVGIGEWNIAGISNDSFDPGIISNNETASIRGKTSYQIIENGDVYVTFSADNGAKVSSFTNAS